MRAVVVGVVMLFASSTSSAQIRGWSATYDRETQYLWGQLAAPKANSDGPSAERIARAFLAAHIDVLAHGASANDFVLVANHDDGHLRTVGFAQRWHGIPVRGGTIAFVFGRDRLFAIVSRALPDVSVTLPVNGTRVIVPVRLGGGRVRYELAEVREIGARHTRARIFVAADGRELAREPLVMTESANLQYNAPVRYARSTRANYAARDATIAVDGNTLTTAADGAFTWMTTTACTVVPSIVGPTVRITNRTGAAATTTLTAQTGQSIVWDLAADEFGDAQLSAFVHVGIAKLRAARVNPTVAAWLAQPLDAFVNENGFCNAYSTGDDIHFFRGASSCENTARIADVIYHEFAHSLHKQSVIAGIGNWEVALSEGLADFYSALITEDSGTGRGFLFSDQPLREIDPVGTEKSFPQDISPDPHETGLIISGALWDLRKALIASEGLVAGVITTERIFAGILARAPDIAGSYMAALLADDDDANLTNGTPHICAIDAAFRPHGLAVDLHELSIGPATLTGLTVEVPVEAGATCKQPSAMTLTWQSSAGASGSFPLTQQGLTWIGELPAQADGTVLQYRVDATLANGMQRALPDNPADPMYQVFIGPTKPIWCDKFDALPDAWTRAASLGAAWQWAPPRGDDDPTAAYTGSHVFGTVLDRDGRYMANDVSYAETPSIDLTGVTTARLQYWRWLTVQDGAADKAKIIATPFNAVLWQNHAGDAIAHVDREWRFHDVDLSSRVGTTTALRWSLDADGGVEYGGWTIDDVCVVTSDPAVCGDSEIGDGEACDDGNRIDGDGCSKLCQIEGGGCCSASTRPEQSLLLVGAVWAWWRRRRRRPGVGM